MRERLPEPIRRPLAKIRYTPGRVGAVVTPLLVAQIALTTWGDAAPRPNGFSLSSSPGGS